jgi:hypothetical protein
MKTLVLIVTASLMIVSATVNAASVDNCPKILNNLKASASAITQNANAYWQRRTRFVSLNYYHVAPNAKTLAGQEESNGNLLRNAMPNRLESFNDLTTAALSLNCISPAQLSVLTEPAIKHVKRVRFDKFPDDEERPTESSVNQVPSRMPNNN